MAAIRKRWASVWVRLLALLRLGPKPPDRWLVQSRRDNCAQTVVAMVTGLPVAQVSKYAGTKGALSVSDTLNLLAQLGVACRPVAAHVVADFWPVFRRREGGRRLRALAFRGPGAGEEYGHVSYILGNRIYDTASGSFTSYSEEELRSMDWIAFMPQR